MITSILTLWLASLILLQNNQTQPVSDPDIPEWEVEDAVMASPAEVQEMGDWVDAVLAGHRPASRPDAIRVEVRRQDFSYLHFGESCMDTPIRIGQRSFKHGLGTHANSEIVVHIPRDAKRFEAFVGVDNNYDTQGIRGSVQFIVELAGREILRSPTLRGSDEGKEIGIDIPPGTDTLTLKTDTTPDGPGWDQCDWADARLIAAKGDVRWLDEGQDAGGFLGQEPPFSFIYAGQESSQFLKSWRRSVEITPRPDRIEYRIRWDDPATALRVTATASVFRRYPAVDWILSLENKGTKDSPIIENIQALDLALATAGTRKPVLLHQINGDDCNERSFLPTVSPIEVGKNLRLAPTGGRPASVSAFPFFNLQYGDRGVIVGLGWTGQWAASFDRNQAGKIRLRAGMDQTHLLLHPGEQIRSPRALLLSWSQDRQAAHNRFRRLIQFHYVPRQNGQPLAMPIALQCFDRYVTRPGWATEPAQIEAARIARQIGCDALWFDAAWFPLGFPNGVGNWFADPKTFPRGLKPVSDECHRQGLRFILWFEPERVAKGSQIAEEHPDFVFGGKEGGLFKLNDPQARAWLTDLLSQRITEFGLDVYRNDFNIDPLDFWRRNDAPDRQGMTEIRYVEGLYAMWDELLARHPGLFIDNCASGGRRIDLETCMRSVPLWRSDTGCSPGHPDWNQLQYAGLGQYVPLHSVGNWSTDTYDCRSATSTGAVVAWPYLDQGFPIDQAKAAMTEIRENRGYCYGDFYPLTPLATGPDSFAVHQFHRPDLDAGLVLAFRRRHCSLVGVIVPLAAIKPDSAYKVDFIDQSRARTIKTLTGKDLAAGLELRINATGSSLAVQYTPSGRQ